MLFTKFASLITTFLFIIYTLSVPAFSETGEKTYMSNKAMPWLQLLMEDGVQKVEETVTDPATGLFWQKAYSQNSWQGALFYCEDLDLAGKMDWRLPNIRELQSIVDYGRYKPSINPAFDCKSDNYWSSSTSVGKPAFAWSVAFYDGNSRLGIKTEVIWVRCVRGGQ